MAKGVFVHRADSIYDDRPEEQYQFPKRYLKRALQFEGDWIVYYEPRGGGGRLGYNAIARVQQIVPDPSIDGMYLAIIDPSSYLPLEKFVPYRDRIGFIESALAKPDGNLNQGLIQWAVRPISDADFLRILNLGFRSDIDVLPRFDTQYPSEQGGLHEGLEPFIFETERERVTQTVSRALRDRVFRRLVLDAYDSRCALTGLKFINGGGRAEVEAAHIRPVTNGGPDSVRNGLALSGTIHWMFDRGLISLSDSYEVLVSRQLNNPDEVWHLVNDDRKARLPSSVSMWPHQRFLEWHRENCFKH